MQLTPKTPWHLWVVGGLSLLWNFGGVVSYTTTKLQALGVANMPAAQLDYYYSFPAWATVFWALGVWGCFFGSLALLLKRKFAVWLFAVSIIGLIGTSIYQWGVSDMPDTLKTTGHIAFALAIWAITIGLFFYARVMAAKNVLK